MTESNGPAHKTGHGTGSNIELGTRDAMIMLFGDKNGKGGMNGGPLSITAAGPDGTNGFARRGAGRGIPLENSVQNFFDSAVTGMSNADKALLQETPEPKKRSEDEIAAAAMSALAGGDDENVQTVSPGTAGRNLLSLLQGARADEGAGREVQTNGAGAAAGEGSARTNGVAAEGAGAGFPTESRKEEELINGEEDSSDEEEDDDDVMDLKMDTPNEDEVIAERKMFEGLLSRWPKFVKTRNPNLINFLKESRDKYQDSSRSFVSDIQGIRDIDLGGWKFPGAYRVACYLFESGSVETLDLYSQEIGSTGSLYLAKAFSIGKTDSLVYVGLYGNKIGDEGLEAIAPYLKKMERLKTLDLRWNDITDNGAMVLLVNVAACSSLKLIDLRFNLMSKEIADQIRGKSSLNHIQILLD
eukprot:g1580.t1